MMTIKVQVFWHVKLLQCTCGDFVLKKLLAAARNLFHIKASKTF